MQIRLALQIQLAGMQWVAVTLQPRPGLWGGSALRRWAGQAAREGQCVLPMAAGAQVLWPPDGAQSVPGQDDIHTTPQHDQRGPGGGLL